MQIYSDKFHPIHASYLDIVHNTMSSINNIHLGPQDWSKDSFFASKLVLVLLELLTLQMTTSPKNWVIVIIPQ